MCCKLEGDLGGRVGQRKCRGRVHKSSTHPSDAMQSRDSGGSKELTEAKPVPQYLGGPKVSYQQKMFVF